jgi:hypothetical protein
MTYVKSLAKYNFIESKGRREKRVRFVIIAKCGSFTIVTGRVMNKSELSPPVTKTEALAYERRK